jgi:hypothetical protein
MINYAKGIRESIAGTYFQHAIYPYHAQSMAIHFGGDGEAITREMVLAEFGVAAAFHWQAARDAKAAYFKAIDDLD